MDLNIEKREKYEKYTHVKFIEIYNYLSNKTYPEQLTDKDLKSNFRKACKKFEIVHNFCTSVLYEIGRGISAMYTVVHKKRDTFITPRPTVVAGGILFYC